MCKKTTCSTCNKAAWVGCGAHVEEVLAGIAAEDRCSCTADGSDNSGGDGLLSRVFGRS